ncbi:hypothetical protein GMLC_38360 [Geomonas limicola]|uniref:Cohesin domain-containing protein n=1 Tax=Geomonas limicola TaxID=2740186 RepID=A0A6V8NEQ2_9BACT|nr:cohesin domain-containing protein [Geomonas limicola]GFO70257.1 hypothetical protein GMLC_38360 [Geomonas limicola]
MFEFKKAVLCQLLLICSLLLSAPAAFAAGSVSIAAAGNGTFNVVASGVPAPHAFHVVVGYDSSLLTVQNVTAGQMASNAIFAYNANVAGSIQIAALSQAGMSGSGVLATITFNQTGSTPGRITVGPGTASAVLDGSLPTAKNIPVSYFAWAPSEQQDTSTTASTGSTSDKSGTTQTSSGTYSVGGTLTMPTDESTAPRKDAPGQQPPQEGRETSQSPPAPASEPAAAPEAPVAAKKVEKYQPRTVTSVLEKFRLFTGEKTPEKLSALFAPDAVFVQTPAIAISDGTSTVTVQITRVPGERAPNFAFSHAKYVSLKQTGEGEWQLELKPDKNAIRAGIVMTVDGVEQEIPLTVLPKVSVDLNKSGGVTEADFAQFLKERGTEKAPKYDLNGDGRRDYQDDYIFTGNYLLQKGAKASGAPKK